MAFTTPSGGGGTGGGGGSTGAVKPVEFVPISGGSSIVIGGAELPGTIEADQSGGVNAPTKRTEEGYDYTTRVNREARTASFDGWVTIQGLTGLQLLRRKKEPFAVVAGHVGMQSAVLDDLQSTAPEDARGGAYEVTVDIREAFQAEAGTTNIEAFATSGKKTGGGDLFGFLSGGGGTSSGSSTGNTEG